MPTVRWTSNKNAGDNTARLVVEGTADKPIREISRGGEGELSDQELDHYSKRYRFTTLDPGEPSSASAPQQDEQQSSEGDQSSSETGATASSKSKSR